MEGEGGRESTLLVTRESQKFGSTYINEWRRKRN